MDKEALATATDLAEAILLGEMARRRTWRRAWFVGATAGMAVGALNLLALSNQWKLLLNCFLPFDLPLDALMINAKGPLDIDSQSNPALQLVSAIVVIVGYWIAIGLFLASLYCLVREGVIKRIVRDRFCRRVLFYGIAVGLFVAGLNLLAFVNRWMGLQRYFTVLDVPIGSLLEEARQQFHLHYSRPPSLAFWLGAFVVYWVLIGFCLASAVCVLRAGSEGSPEI